MRVLTLSFVLMASLFLAAPAMAGKVSYVDGRGKWVPTGCVAPAQPAPLSRNPEAAANDLNARIAERNRYSAEVEAYMACVSKEAQNDAEAFGILITDSAQNIIDQAQRDVANVSARVDTKGSK